MKNQEEAGTLPATPAPSSATVVADQDQRKVLKFGFSAKGSAAKVFASFVLLIVPPTSNDKLKMLLLM